jgi:outer membrane lipoprotein carrier protein
MIKILCTTRAGLLLLASALPAAALADRVQDYFATLDSFQADFSQQVIDTTGEQVQNSTGRVWIKRPGRFRWDYRTPYHQLIIADGEQLWTYDEDLEQATVKMLDEALSSTPAVLLSGYRPIEEVMSWQPETGDDGLDWYRLKPKQTDAGVDNVRIAFDGDELSLIEVVDGFGNHTRIRFSGIHRNRTLDAGLFRMTLPEGTDLIGASP